jgi:hypothetical protein
MERARFCSTNSISSATQLKGSTASRKEETLLTIPAKKEGFAVFLLVF